MDALREEAAWAECEAFEGFKAEMAGVADARKRADDKHRTERLLDDQVRFPRASLFLHGSKDVMIAVMCTINPKESEDSEMVMQGPSTLQRDCSCCITLSL